LIIFSVIIGCLSSTTNSKVYANEVAPAAITTNEIEPNNTDAQAQEIYSDYTIYGNVTRTSTTYDIYDTFCIVSEITGTANFWVGDFPASIDINIVVYDEDATIVEGSSGTGTQRYISIPVVKGTLYYATVCLDSSSSNGISSTYTFRTRMFPTSYSYYGQYPLQGFNTNNLTNYGWINSDGIYCSLEDLITDAGCFMCSFAMVLDNMSKQTTTQRYDYRTNTSGYLLPDPYTVTLANVNFTSPIYNSTDNKYCYPTSNPVSYNSLPQLTGHFGATASVLYLSQYSAEQKAEILTYYLSENPEGIIAGYSTSSNTHAIVFASTTYEIPSNYSPPVAQPASSVHEDGLLMGSYISEESIAHSESIIRNRALSPFSNTTVYGSQFIVYDPVNGAAGVSFDRTWTGTEMGWDALQRIIIFD